MARREASTGSRRQRIAKEHRDPAACAAFVLSMTALRRFGDPPEAIFVDVEGIPFVLMTPTARLVFCRVDDRSQRPVPTETAARSFDAGGFLRRGWHRPFANA